MLDTCIPLDFYPSAFKYLSNIYLRLHDIDLLIFCMSVCALNLKNISLWLMWEVNMGHLQSSFLPSLQILHIPSTRLIVTVPSNATAQVMDVTILPPETRGLSIAQVGGWKITPICSWFHIRWQIICDRTLHIWWLEMNGSNYVVFFL